MKVTKRMNLVKKELATNSLDRWDNTWTRAKLARLRRLNKEKHTK